MTRAKSVLNNANKWLNSLLEQKATAEAERAEANQPAEAKQTEEEEDEEEEEKGDDEEAKPEGAPTV